MSYTANLIWLLLAIIFSAFVLAPKQPTIFLIGDSTLADKQLKAAPETGWGTAFAGLIDQGAARVENHAMNGRSTKSFLSEGRWANIADKLTPGDYVLIQFGHNDQKIQDSTRYAAAESTYQDNLRRFITETRAKGAIPVLITPVVRRRFDEQNQLVHTLGSYPDAVKKVAATTSTPVIDLNTLSAKRLTELGPDLAKSWFLHLKPDESPNHVKGLADDTHFSPFGAAEVAKLVASEIVRQDLPLTAHLKHFGGNLKYQFELPTIEQVSFRKDTFRISDFGAENGVSFTNTGAIQRAIDRCSESGGGTVLIPPGFWLSGPFTLKSDVNLHLSQGALLQFSDNFDDYPIVETNWEGQAAIRCQSPISATNAHNVAITGGGVIDGAGQVWRQVKKEKLTESQWKKLVASGGVLDDKKRIWYPTERAKTGHETPGAGSISAGYTVSSGEQIKEFLRPNMIRITQCRRVLLEGVTFQNSPAWNVHPTLTDHLTVRNVKIRNPWYAQNGDGLDVESCRYVLIENSTFDVGDDAICLKSGRDAEGRKRGIPTAYVIVRNSVVFHGHGGFVIGSEMSGGVHDIYVDNCTFHGTDVGLRFKTKRDRGGVVENIFISNIQMASIPGEAVLFDMYYEAKDPVPQDGQTYQPPVIKAEPVGEGTPQFRNFHIRNLVCKGAETGILIRGLPEMPIRNISLDHISISSNRGLICVEGEGISISNAEIIARDKTPLHVHNSKGITLDRITYAPEVGTVLRAGGPAAREVKLINTEKPKSGKLRENLP